MIGLREQFRHGVDHTSIRHHFEPGSCPDVTRAAAFAVELEQYVVQEILDGADGLASAILSLHQHQEFKGFIQDNLSRLGRIRVYSRDHVNFLLAQNNPGRANRSSGAGRTEPPILLRLKENHAPFCFLCERHQKWQQRGLQVSYRRRLADMLFRFCCNPFPFGRYHTTVVSDAHLPQQWEDGDDLERMLAAMLDLGMQLPGWVVIYNGVGAGATIRYHRHFHLLKIESSQEPFPLQHAASEKAKSVATSSPLPIVGGRDYPVTAIRLRGASNVILVHALRLALSWHNILPGAATENVAVVWEESGLSLYYIPRDNYCRAPGFSGEIAGLEVLGEVVFSAESDLLWLGGGRGNYEKLREMLAAVSPLRARSLLEDL